MPERGITRVRIRDHLRRLWSAYLIGAVALCLLNHVVFTMTRPGFSEEETLKIMLLNADISLSEQVLLKETEHLGFRAVQTVELSFAPEDPTSRMLLVTQLVAGDGDIYITDAAGLSVLQERGVCHTVRRIPDGTYLAAIRSGTELQSALGALDILEEKLGE